MFDASTMESTGRRGSLALCSFTLGIVLLAASTACRDVAKNEVSVTDASPTPESGASTPVDTASIAIPVARPPEDEREVGDGGADGGSLRRKRRLASAADAGGAIEALATPPAPSAEPATEKPHGKRPPAPMGNEQPYGGSGGSSRPGLQKAPLPNDDPWQKAPGAP